ncbi:helix-turn-helix domain-containing protein [Limosilactobacillus reuteri]|uniref:helix-turn-helix domain-containing protein n=1 Tax=Limosilactobacillus reuteri TaxID=1598 RepID=UPI001E6221D6|nr:helix-turn-helix transcriptional regulator [Limosilactobacillus reuteri]MCC4466137.1 helix-turn-helix transcriptional regulator [Limosilactobacillus reuteri]MCC4472361.1 helix-turn-helix transcriptional regulator [Limosilactobacillus reuteri]
MNRIRKCRQNKKLTLKQLSEELAKQDLKISADALGKYERGEREPKLETWIKLADFFDVPVSYLQGLSDHNYNDREAATRAFLERNPDFVPLPDGVSLDDVDFSKSVELTDASDIDLQMRDSYLKQFQKLVTVFLSKSSSDNWIAIREDQRKKMIKIVNSLDDKKIDEVVNYVSMAFYMLLDGDSNDKNSLKKAIDDFCLKYITDEGGFN